MSQPIINDLVVTKICSVSRIHQPADTKKFHHMRERCALAVELRGETIYYDLNGLAPVVSDASHICFLPTNSSYSYTCVKPSECLMIEFEASGLTSRDLLTIDRDPEQLEQFIHLFDELERSFVFGRNDNRPQSLAVLYQILGALVQSSLPDDSEVRKQSIIEPAILYLENHVCDQNLDCALLASVCGISEVYFRKLFTALYKIPPMTYIRKVRVEQAKGLLIADYATVADVAEKVGFTNVFHFSRVFKQLTGKAPGAYASEQRKQLGLPAVPLQ